MKPIYQIKETAIFVNMVGVYLDDLNTQFNDISLPSDVLLSIDNFYKDNNTDSIITCSPFSNSHESIDKMCYVFFSLKCERKQKIAFNVFRTGHLVPFWIDGELLDYAANNNFHTISLSEGIHHFVWRYPEFMQESGVQVRLNSIENDAKDPLTSWTQNNFMLNEPKFNLIDITEDIDNSKTAKFYIACGNRLQTDYERGLELKVVKYPSNVILEERVCHINEIISVDMNKYDDDEYTVLMWKCWDMSGRSYATSDPYYYKDVRKQLERIEQRAVELLKKDLSIPERAFAEAKLLEIRSRLEHNTVHVYYNYNLEKDLIDVENGTYKNKLTSPGWLVGAVPSSPDGRPVEYRLYIPHGYDNTKKYPIIVRYSTFFKESTVRYFEFNKWDKSFVLDIDAGGVTFGSYIGEALFLDALNYVLNEYPIDSNRIYGCGFCAGASGIFAIAEEHPDLFAAINVYGGTFNVTKTNNICNVPIIHFESEERASTLRYHDLFSKNSDYQLIYADDFGHQTLETISLNNLVFENLLKYKRDECPKEIDFTTTMLRSNKAYWITINSFGSGETTGRIIASIQNNEIKINTINLESISINVPSYAPKYDIIINGETVDYATSGDVCHYNKVTDKFVRSDHQVTQAIYAGSGLLDVYFSPMMVVNLLPNDDNAKQTAVTMATPSNNSYCPMIYVSYPVISDIPSDPVIRASHSFIIIDSNSDSPYLAQLRSESSVNMRLDGYSCEGKNYVGDYCIMEIISNPDNKEHSILYINTNNPNLLHYNLLTRKMIIPTYINARRSILNKNIYIYDRNSNDDTCIDE